MLKYALVMATILAPLSAHANVTYYWQTLSINSDPADANQFPSLNGQITLTDQAYLNGSGMVDFGGNQFISPGYDNSNGSVASLNLASVSYKGTDPAFDDAQSYVQASFVKSGIYLQGSGTFESFFDTLTGSTGSSSDPNVWTFTDYSEMNGCHSGCTITGLLVDDPPKSVPEPGSFSLLMAGLLGLGSVFRLTKSS